MDNYPSSRYYRNSSFNKHLSQQQQKSRNDPVVKCKVNDNCSNYKDLMNGFGVRCKPKKKHKNSLKYRNLSLRSLHSFSRTRKMCKSKSSRVVNRSRVRSMSASKRVITGKMGMVRNRCHSNTTINLTKQSAKTGEENCIEDFYCSNCVASQRNKRKFCGSCGIEMNTENDCKSKKSTKCDDAPGSRMRKTVGADGPKINDDKINSGKGNQGGKSDKNKTSPGKGIVGGKSDKDNVNSGKGNQGGKSDKDKTSPGKGILGGKSDKDNISSGKDNQGDKSDKNKISPGKGILSGKSDKDNVNSGKGNQGGKSDKDKTIPGKGILGGKSDKNNISSGKDNQGDKSDNNDALSEEKRKGGTSDIENGEEIKKKDCLEACRKCEQCKKDGDNVKKNYECDDLNLCISSCKDNPAGHAVVKINEMQVFEGKNLSIRIEICESDVKKNTSCAPCGSKRKSCSFKPKSSVCDNYQCKINECLVKKLLEMKNYCDRHNLRARMGSSCEENNSYDNRRPTGSCNAPNCPNRNQFANISRNICSCESYNPHSTILEKNRCNCGSELKYL